MMVLTIFLLGVFALALGIYAFSSYKQQSKQILESLQQTDSQLKRYSEKESELQQEIGSLQNRVNELLKDNVTALPAWPLFADRVTQVIHECERYHLVMGVLYVDINDFQTVNNALGSNNGDAFLCEIASRLQTCIRQVDMLSRQSKDIFVIMLARLAKPETAVVVAQRILIELSQPIKIDGKEVLITANIGLAMYPNDGKSAEDLLLRAEQALQLSKSKGKQGFQFYQGELQQQAQRELIIYSNIGKESIFNEFKLFFQPIVDVTSESILGVDTLLEWHHPEVGKLSAAEIYAYAEKQGKLIPVCDWLVRSAAKQFLSWRAAGFTPKLLAIPLAIKAFENSQFVQHMAQTLKELNFDPSMLLIEVPENFSHSSFEILEKSFNMLRYLNVRIGLDHFGAGSLALRYLKAFPFDYFKLERMLVDDVVENARTRDLLQSVLALAKNLSIDVIVQGVENQQQANVLRELGYTLMQGSVTGAPVLKEKVLEKFT